MTKPSSVISIRLSSEDRILLEQAARQSGQAVSTWMREAARQTALNDLYPPTSPEVFPNTPGEVALLRAVLVILQTVGENTSDDTKRLYAERAARQIEKIRSENQT